MRDAISHILVRVTAGVLLLLMTGCMSTGGEKVSQPSAAPPPLFAPQSVIRSGDYSGFLAENQETLKNCKDPDECAAALLNLGFLYSYSKSPYFNPKRGTLYFEDLIKGSPESPWAYQARLWLDLMKNGLPKIVKKRPAKEEAKSKEAAAAASVPASQGETQPENQQQDLQDQQQPQAPVEAQRVQYEHEIRNRDEIIRELSRQLEQSRQIDMEIERKQRKLPY